MKLFNRLISVLSFPLLTDNQEAFIQYAISRIKTCRTYLNGAYIQGLNSNIHSEENKLKIVDKLFDQMTNVLTENPLSYGIKYDTYFMIIKKN